MTEDTRVYSRLVQAGITRIHTSGRFLLNFCLLFYNELNGRKIDDIHMMEYKSTSIGILRTSLLDFSLLGRLLAASQGVSDLARDIYFFTDK